MPANIPPEELKRRHEKMQAIAQRCSDRNRVRRQQQKEILSQEIKRLSSRELESIRINLKDQL